MIQCNFMLRRALWVLLAFFLMAGSVHAQLSGDTYAEARSKKVANITLSYVETPGFSARDAQGNMRGICVDIMEQFAAWVKETEGIDMRFTYSHKDADDFSQFMNNVKASDGGVFGLGNVTITEERKQTYHFSPPFITNIAILMTNKSVPTLQSMEDIATRFASMQAVTAKGTLNEKRINKIRDNHFPGLTYKYVPSSSACLEEVANNPNAFTNLDFTYYLEALKKGMSVKRHPIGDESTESFGIVMPKSNDWSQLLNKFMQNGYTESSEYREMIAAHLGPNALRLLDAVAKKSM